MMVLRQKSNVEMRLVFLLLLSSFFFSSAKASYGDRLPEFGECVEVCTRENCVDGGPSISLFHRLLLWTCPAECDYTCQHIITDQRVESSLPIVQFHGKWPFYRALGMQEPFSVLFSLLNLVAHYDGQQKLLAKIPASYSMRKYYIWLSYFGISSWVFSMIFHTRDFAVTEQLDYFAAGASVLYGLYYTPIRIFRLDKTGQEGLLKAWALLCICMYACHVMYLKLYSWDYTYNMAANVTVGLVQNVLWTWFSITNYQKSKRMWATWPGMVVAWVLVAMSFELLDFPPFWGCLDAHSLWHLGTVAPTVLWYNFLLKDAQDDMAGVRLKA